MTKFISIMLASLSIVGCGAGPETNASTGTSSGAGGTTSTASATSSGTGGTGGSGGAGGQPADIQIGDPFCNPGEGVTPDADGLTPLKRVAPPSWPFTFDIVSVPVVKGPAPCVEETYKVFVLVSKKYPEAHPAVSQVKMIDGASLLWMKKANGSTANAVMVLSPPLTIVAGEYLWIGTSLVKTASGSACTLRCDTMVLDPESWLSNFVGGGYPVCPEVDCAFSPLSIKARFPFVAFGHPG